METVLIAPPRRPKLIRPAGRMVSLVLGIALLCLGVGTAVSLAEGADAVTLGARGPRIVQVGTAGTMRLAAATPGDTTTSITTIRYRGDDPAEIRVYGEVEGTGLARYLHVTIARGSGEGAAWTPETGEPLFEGTLAELPSAWDGGLTGAGRWTDGDRGSFRISVTLLDDPRAQGRTSDATFRWEARPA